MNGFTSLLAATDFSTPARHAAERAARLAAAGAIPLALLHVVRRRALAELRVLLGADAVPVEQRMLDQSREELDRLATDLGRPFAVTVSAHLATGNVAEMIAGHAALVGADLLVVGAQGQGFMQHAVPGSTAERLLRLTLQPVLVVKQTPIEAYRRVLVPVDLSRWSPAALALARAAAPRAGIVLLHAFEVPFERKLHTAGIPEDEIARLRADAQQSSLQQMHELAATAGLDPASVRYCVRHGDASRQIVEQEQVLDCDLIVLGKHGQGMIEELLLGSVTRRVLAESKCDVLVSTQPTD